MVLVLSGCGGTKAMADKIQKCWDAGGTYGIVYNYDLFGDNEVICDLRK